VSSSAAILKEIPQPEPAVRPRQVDGAMFAGILIALTATIAGIIATGVRPGYFLQPTGALIVLGGTLGAVILATPRSGLAYSAKRVRELLWTPDVDRIALIEEIMLFVRPARAGGLLAIERMIGDTPNQFLKESLLLTLDVQNRTELQATLETKLRHKERQGETDAKVLEVAGGFAPTIGVLGTVVGLIDVLRQFSNLASVAGGVGTAFVSTIYGLALANLVLLPAAHRIRARVADAFEIHELIMEGVLCIYDGMHPSLVRERLNCFLREANGR
jgi:chemotaxis protein MotA